MGYGRCYSDAVRRIYRPHCAWMKDREMYRCVTASLHSSVAGCRCFCSAWSSLWCDKHIAWLHRRLGQLGFWQHLSPWSLQRAPFLPY